MVAPGRIARQGRAGNFEAWRIPEEGKDQRRTITLKRFKLFTLIGFLFGHGCKGLVGAHWPDAGDYRSPGRCNRQPRLSLEPMHQSGSV